MWLGCLLGTFHWRSSRHIRLFRGLREDPADAGEIIYISSGLEKPRGPPKGAVAQDWEAWTALLDLLVPWSKHGWATEKWMDGWISWLWQSGSEIIQDIEDNFCWKKNNCKQIFLTGASLLKLFPSFFISFSYCIGHRPSHYDPSSDCNNCRNLHSEILCINIFHQINAAFNKLFECTMQAVLVCFIFLSKAMA